LAWSTMNQYIHKSDCACAAPGLPTQVTPEGFGPGTGPWLCESVRLTVCAGSMAGCRQRIVVGKRSAKKMTN
jgi:hypothetical protein